MTLRCSKCKKTFKGPQGLATHMKWHDRTSMMTNRAPGHFQERLLNVLEQHPDGLSCGEIAAQMQKEGYKKTGKTSMIAQRVSSAASSMKSTIVRMGRGTYRLKNIAPPHQGIEKTHDLTLPEIPVQTLHLRIDHLELENGRLRRAITLQNQTMQTLLSGDLA